MRSFNIISYPVLGPGATPQTGIGQTGLPVLWKASQTRPTHGCLEEASARLAERGVMRLSGGAKGGLPEGDGH